VILSVLAEVAKSYGLLDLGWEFVFEFVLELANFFLELAFDVFRHGYDPSRLIGHEPYLTTTEPRLTAKDNYS
jgi:hypothetical protein